MSGRSYGQYCAVAHALDVVGARWTLLVVRELLRGPARYTDLLGGLPGIATDLLASRLRELEEDGVIVRRRLPPPAASTVYELTDDGRGLSPVVEALAEWGLGRLGDRGGDAFDPRWMATTVASFLRPREARGLDCTFELRFPDGTFAARLTRGRLDVLDSLDEPDVVIETDVDTLVHLVRGTLTLRDAALRTRGDPAALAGLARAFGLAGA